MVDSTLFFEKEDETQEKTYKILFTGLDGAGKTSIILSLQREFSKIAIIEPTKGAQRSSFNLMGRIISEWDLGGQKRYREKYLEQSKFYLYNIDLLFFLIDIQDFRRLMDSLELFSNIIESLKELDEYPPIVICLNKFDPDLKGSEEINKNVQIINFKQTFKNISQKKDKCYYNNDRWVEIRRY